MLEMRWIPMGSISALSRGVSMLDNLSEHRGCVRSALTSRVLRGAAQRTEAPS